MGGGHGLPTTKKELKPVPDQVTKDYEEATKALEKMKRDKGKAKPKAVAGHTGSISDVGDEEWFELGDDDMEKAWSAANDVKEEVHFLGKRSASPSFAETNPNKKAKTDTKPGKVLDFQPSAIPGGDVLNILVAPDQSVSFLISL